ncbi:hypothetical protein TNIN_183181 [Trichonephila inaurata madagascariensis]|uniref:Uncharacterized protein n=1 Tax=Trichonephila inaurata madagascariensis TaxID=2747483 RepID=A0A8X6ICR8_9ARAC|nr:hypothetical protein TNIN_183181 [Trichonephila inaurata madagascariensis]
MGCSEIWSAERERVKGLKARVVRQKGLIRHRLQSFKASECMVFTLLSISNSRAFAIGRAGNLCFRDAGWENHYHNSGVATKGLELSIRRSLI